MTKFIALFTITGFALTTGCNAGEPKPDSIPERKILFANEPYRILAEQDQVSALIDENWFELDRSRDADFFILNPAAWTVEHQAEEPCSGLPTERLIGGFGENTQFFLNLPGLFLGSVWDYPISNGVLRAGMVLYLALMMSTNWRRQELISAISTKGKRVAFISIFSKTASWFNDSSNNPSITTRKQKFSEFSI